MSRVISIMLALALLLRAGPAECFHDAYAHGHGELHAPSMPGLHSQKASAAIADCAHCEICSLFHAALSLADGAVAIARGERVGPPVRVARTEAHGHFLLSGLSCRGPPAV